MIVLMENFHPQTESLNVGTCLVEGGYRKAVGVDQLDVRPAAIEHKNRHLLVHPQGPEDVCSFISRGKI